MDNQKPSLSEQLQQKEEALNKIAHLCPNCRNLSDAQSIASGQDTPSTKNGCSQCDVEELDSQSRWLIEQSEFLIYTLEKIWKRGGLKKTDFYHVIIEGALRQINRWENKR